MDNPRSTPPAIFGHLSVDLVLLRLDPSTAPPESRRSSRIRSLLPRLSSGEPPHAGKDVAMEHNPQHTVLAAGNLYVGLELLRLDPSVRPAAASCIACRLEEDIRE